VKLELRAITNSDLNRDSAVMMSSPCRWQNTPTTVWAPGTAPLPAKKKRPGRGRPAKRLRRDRKHRPLSVETLALRLPKRAWQTITWREGAAAPLSSRFARLRVRPAHRDEKLTEPRPQEWLLIEWPEGEKTPTKYWLSTPAGKHRFCGACRSCQAALAHRARLPGAQAGGRARTLRRARMAAAALFKNTSIYQWLDEAIGNQPTMRAAFES
jgi:hypothetical protein